MKAKGPILTLLAVVVLALILLAVNLTTSPEDPSSTQAGQNAPAAPPAAAPAAPPAVADPAAPPADTFPAQATYTGRTSGRKAGEAAVAVAVAVKDGRVSAYLCDGKKLESWLDGRTQGSALESSGKDGSRLDGTLADGRLSGQVSVAGQTWSFSAAPGASPAGLYRARNSTADAGWIVYPDGSQTGVQNLGGTASEAPRLDPAAGRADLGGTSVPVATIQGGDAASVGR